MLSSHHPKAHKLFRLGEIKCPLRSSCTRVTVYLSNFSDRASVVAFFGGSYRSSCSSSLRKPVQRRGSNQL